MIYQFYNADLLDIPANPDEAAMAYVDDAILIATGKKLHRNTCNTFRHDE